MNTIKREIIWNDTSAYLPIPKDLWESLGIKLKEKPELSIMIDKSKHGEFMGVWNPEKQKKDKEAQNGN